MRAQFKEYDDLVIKLKEIGVEVREAEGASDVYYHFYQAIFSNDMMFSDENLEIFICRMEGFLAGYNYYIQENCK